MKNMKKIIALVLVAVIVFCFSGCSLFYTEETVECTCPGCQVAKAKLEGGAGEAASDYGKLEASSKSGVDCSKQPESKEDIYKLYVDVANATKAAKDQTVKVNIDGLKIAIDTISLDKSGEPLSSTMMGIVSGLIDSFAPAANVTEYHFVDGKDANGNKTDEGEAKTPQNTLPVTGTDVLCDMPVTDVKDATLEVLSDGYWKINISINDANIDLVDAKNTPDTPHAHCMITLKASDLIKNFGDSAAITKANLQFRDSVITAIIDPESGYLVQLYTGLNIYGKVEGNISTLGIGGIHGDLAKTTSYITYDWSKIG